MLKTLRISWDIQQTYLVNSILYSLKQTPILKHIMPAYPYRVHGLKVFAGVLSLIWNILKLFGGKALYFLIFLGWAGDLTSAFPAEEVYLFRLLLLTVIGTIINTSFAEPSYQRYYAVNLLRMNAKTYTLSHFWAGLVKVLSDFCHSPCSLALETVCRCGWIYCGKEHFKALDAGVELETATSWTELRKRI